MRDYQRGIELFGAAALLASMAVWIVWQLPVGVNLVFQKSYGLVYVPGQYDFVIAIIASALLSWAIPLEASFAPVSL